MRVVGIRVLIVRFVDAAQPGWVECQLEDVLGRRWLFIEKVPVVSTEDLDQNSRFPRPGIIACEVLERRRDENDHETIVVDTERPWHIAASSGETRFEIRPEQLVSLE
jgi:hypothetical protein